MSAKLSYELTNGSYEELKQKFHIKDDFTPEELEEYNKYPLD